ncbi:MAG: aminotransferase class III-fold pyridoxal phosphate-dependent enzyme [Nitrososphaerota archaeon]|jgi:4-aminobutyrate aminotransferase|nr:aminotransferase class III-fold pyridoxal phosphate-dependent enzyme [Nitrososphaerota archaeon]MDG6943013.1 aminotransferase class III-fold pyridoxal phosphate-dependent enzyme [Nitrososphaerota archaeon]MDG6950742.1 aminotransferase class III-fold pyridoxal phosphate-dependent enzyme [Nitrososphaerota archaeon]
MNSRKFARIKGKLPGPNANAVVRDTAKYVSPSISRFYPLVVKSAHGSLVRDVDGNQFIDFAAGIAVLSTGSTHPKVVEAVKRQAEKFIHFSYTDFYYDNLVQLSEKLLPLIPGNDRKMVYYGNSGAEAIEAAMKLTRNHTKRPLFLAHSGAFHGRTMGALSLTASKPMQRKGSLPLIPDVVHFPYPYCYRCPWKQTFPECDYYCVDYFKDQYLDKFVPVGDVASYFFEPIQGEGGYVPAPPEYFKKMEFLRSEGVLFVCDEIQTGVGRTGKFLGIEHYGIVPDVVTIAKGIASGLPLSATIAKTEVMESWKPGQHASTFGANPVAVEAALATLDIIKSEKLLENARRLGDKAKKRFLEMKEKYEIVGDVRGKGFFVGVEIVKDKQTKARGDEEAASIIDYCFNHGVLVIFAGHNTLRFIPPLNVTEDVMDEGIDIMEEGIAVVNSATTKA